MANLIETLNAQNMKQEVPVIEVGSTVRVHIKVKEGSKERIQIFEGTVIAKKHGSVSETFTVRRISYGVGVEKVFPVHSPNVVKVETVRRGKVRRAKLYYLRGRVGKAAKIAEKL
ncbi:MAG: 50S ribosomal protein L19 [Clostridiales bacterium]|nr:50S ribosomal protein L19 [Clostridiales bacterium]MCD7919876.1 50S ribosomal protein L19 [Clostridiales bacterium]